MTVTPFAFALPPANEATTPPERRGVARDDVRLLVTGIASGEHSDASFSALPSLLRPGDLLVVNDSATLPAALNAQRADGERFVLHLSTQLATDRWIAEPRLSAPAMAPGERASLAAGGSVTFELPADSERPRRWTVVLDLPLAVDAFLARHGAPIRYRYAAERFPLADYQTIFARVPGSAEMPSAGRPFSARTLAALSDAGVRVATITLHCGVSSPERHERPYRERFEVPCATADAVNVTRRRGGRVIAVGTTVVRALETAVQTSREGAAAITASGWTDLVVTLERGVALVDGVLTGLHEPEASHLDLLRAFAPDAVLARAYDHAVAQGYLWHEFGDVHLIA